jgi:hypothetical protein
MKTVGKQSVVLTWVTVPVGTKALSCKCRNDLEHWERFTSRVADSCAVIGCLEKDLVGAWVKKTEGADQLSYVAPLCSEHCKETGELPVNGGMLVTARKHGKCRGAGHKSV